MHDFGTTDERVAEQIRLINDEVENLCKDLKDTIVVVTADHGLVDVEWKSLCDYPEIADTLERVPSIESRAMSIFVKKGRKKDFENAFEKVFGNDYILFTHDEVVKNGLFGRGNLILVLKISSAITLPWQRETFASIRLNYPTKSS